MTDQLVWYQQRMHNQDCFLSLLFEHMNRYLVTQIIWCHLQAHSNQIGKMYYNICHMLILHFLLDVLMFVTIGHFISTSLLVISLFKHTNKQTNKTQTNLVSMILV